MQSVKQITAQQAADLIQDGDNVILGGFIGAVVPESIEKAIEDKFGVSAAAPGAVAAAPAAGASGWRSRR